MACSSLVRSCPVSMINQPNQTPFMGHPPGRIIEEITRKVMPSGAVVESRRVTLTVIDPNTGVIRTQVLQEQNPQVACCGMAKDLNQITECGKNGCRALICEVHSLVCPVCGVVCCLTCTEETENEKVRKCKDCSDKIHKPVISILRKLLWG